MSLLLALSVISLLRSDSVAFGCEADMRAVDRSNQSDVNDPEPTLTGLKCRSAAVFRPAEVLVSFPSEAREALSSETAGVHHAARRRGGVARGGKGAAADEVADRRVSRREHAGSTGALGGGSCAAAARAGLD